MQVEELKTEVGSVIGFVLPRIRGPYLHGSPFHVKVGWGESVRIGCTTFSEGVTTIILCAPLEFGFLESPEMASA